MLFRGTHADECMSGRQIKSLPDRPQLLIARSLILR